MKASKLWKWICCNVVSDKLKIITHQRQMQHHGAIQWDWIGWISGLSYRAPTVLIIWNWYLVYFLKWYFEAGKAGEEKACQGCKRVAACSGWEAIWRSNARSNENNLLEKETIKSEYFQILDKYWRSNKIKSHKRSEYFLVILRAPKWHFLHPKQKSETTFQYK